MNKLIIILAVMLVVLGCVWFFKSTTPTEERNDTVNITEDDKWWDTSLLSNIKTDTAWMLDPEIPVNYIPVIDQEEVYMVLNDDGTINRYRRRYKDEEGDWVWEDIIEDDMPVSFKPVPGEDNIFSYGPLPSIVIRKIRRTTSAASSSIIHWLWSVGDFR